jgi:sec-independent protein translocase protein TatB
MFDIGASEIFVIGVVALIVIGPERLPRVAKTLGHLFGRLQRYVSEVKADISREMELEELRQLKSTMQDAARSIEQSVNSQVNYIDSEVKQAGSEMQKQVESAVAPITGMQQVPPANAPTGGDAAPSTERTTSSDAAAQETPDQPGRSTNDKPV